VSISNSRHTTRAFNRTKWRHQHSFVIVSGGSFELYAQASFYDRGE
jgi:hypothetical protein